MPDQKDIDQLLAIIRDENQPAAVRQQALQQLLQREAEAQAHLQEAFQAALPADQQEADAAYAHLQQRMRPARVVPLRKWLSVAAALVVCIGAAWLLLPPKSRPPAVAHVPVVTPNVTTAPRFDTIRNTSATTSFHRLPDGSTVHLEANSYLHFRDSFKIVLHGSGLFTVNTATNHSFSVFVNGIEVLDLGTVFSITSQESAVKVKLIQGKVLIKTANPRLAMKDIALQPGQEFRIDTTTQLFAVHNTLPANRVRETKLNKPLIFKNTSLQEVFNSVEKACGVSIHFNKNEIADKAFTGTFDAGSNARNIIAMVCMINDLNYELSNNTIYVHK